MKFLVDMALAPSLARWLREQGHDAVHASELALDRAPDTEIMERARTEARTVVTADLDYPRLLAISGADAPSLILFRDGNWSDADLLARMAEVLAAVSEADISQSIIVVERRQLRRRRLPLNS